MRQRRQISQGCQRPAVSGRVICVRKISIQQHALCPYPSLGVSEGSIGRNEECGGKSGALALLAPGELQLIQYVIPASLSSCCPAAVGVPRWDKICVRPCCLWWHNGCPPQRAVCCAVGSRETSKKKQTRGLECLQNRQISETG